MAAKKGNKYHTARKTNGRKTLYKAEFAEQAYKLTLLGATDAELADFFGVSEQSVNAWKKRHKDFLESIKKGKRLADADVADRLYQRAMGFEHDSVEIKVVDGGIVEVPVRKVYPPDATSAIFWLKNRQPDKWRDKTTTELTGRDGKDLFAKLTDDELDAKITEMETKLKKLKD